MTKPGQHYIMAALVCLFCHRPSDPTVPFAFLGPDGVIVGKLCADCWEGILDSEATGMLRDADAAIRKILEARK
jgi:hypothetical protein